MVEVVLDAVDSRMSLIWSPFIEASPEAGDPLAEVVCLILVEVLRPELGLGAGLSVIEMSPPGTGVVGIDICPAMPLCSAGDPTALVAVV